MGDSSLSIWGSADSYSNSIAQQPLSTASNHMAQPSTNGLYSQNGGGGFPSNQGGGHHSGVILSESKPLLTLMTYIRQCQEPPDTDLLHQRVLHQVEMFIQKCRENQYPNYLIEPSTYCLCAALDEAVLSTKWGTQSIWVQKTLLGFFRFGNSGGENFYSILDELAREPRKNIEVLELIYFILSLGFEGKYYGEKRIYRDEFRNRLFGILKLNKDKFEMQLSPHWKDSQPIVDRKHRQTRLKKFSFYCFSLMAVIWAGFNFTAYQHSRSLLKMLSQIGGESPITAYSQLIERALFPNQYKHE